MPVSKRCLAAVLNASSEDELRCTSADLLAYHVTETAVSHLCLLFFLKHTCAVCHALEQQQLDDEQACPAEHRLLTATLRDLWRPHLH